MRRLAPDEAALWQRVIASVKPMRAVTAAKAASSPDKGSAGGAGGSMPPATPVSKEAVKRAEVRAHPQPLPARSEGSKKGESSNTLDGSWDRQLARGLVSPESSIDLHGHSLSSAYDRLDHGLEQAIARGQRVLLLVTGKPPRAESERPHARGAIRAAVGDWLASSRHAGAIAAVRGAHPRHGGSGALYIVLRRPRAGDSRKKS